jgi:hypothetical protein
MDEKWTGEMKADEHGVDAQAGGDIPVPSNPLVSLVRFLAQYQEQLNELRGELLRMTPEECHDALAMKWPVIQGTSNQIKLKRIGELGYDPSLVAEAVDALLADGHETCTAATKRDRDPFEIADEAISLAYPSSSKGKGYWGEQRIPNHGLLRGAIASLIEEDRGTGRMGTVG